MAAPGAGTIVRSLDRKDDDKRRWAQPAGIWHRQRLGGQRARSEIELDVPVGTEHMDAIRAVFEDQVKGRSGSWAVGNGLPFRGRSAPPVDRRPQIRRQENWDRLLSKDVRTKFLIRGHRSE